MISVLPLFSSHFHSSHVPHSPLFLLLFPPRFGFAENWQSPRFVLLHQSPWREVQMDQGPIMAALYQPQFLFPIPPARSARPPLHPFWGKKGQVIKSWKGIPLEGNWSSRGRGDSRCWERRQVHVFQKLFIS